MNINDLKRGTLVEFVEGNFDTKGCNILKGDKGVVFEPYNHYGDNNGPMVRWFNGGACNIYPSMVKVLKS